MMPDYLTLIENLKFEKNSGSFHIRKDGIARWSLKKSAHCSHKIFDPSLALHWISRGGSDKGDLQPSQVQCTDRWATKQPSHGHLRINECIRACLLIACAADDNSGRFYSVCTRNELKVPAALPRF